MPPKRCPWFICHSRSLRHRPRDGATKADFGLEERFTFMFSFDFLSVIERKNPFAVVDAFKSAFAPDEGPQLLIKSINGNDRLRDLERLRWATRDRSDIVVHDGYLDSVEAGSLMSVIDCYVSLHRAEGLGLTMSEAMCLGKPVIATAYSGNMDFMTPDTAALVPWDRISIGTNAAPYPPTANWAEPSVTEAAAAMHRLYIDPLRRAALGTAAQRDLAERFSPALTGARMVARLETIWSTRHA